MSSVSHSLCLTLKSLIVGRSDCLNGATVGLIPVVLGDAADSRCNLSQLFTSLSPPPRCPGADTVHGPAGEGAGRGRFASPCSRCMHGVKRSRLPSGVSYMFHWRKVGTSTTICPLRQLAD